MVVRHHGVPVADIPASALTDGAPVYQREARRPAYLDETSRLDAGRRRPGRPRHRRRAAALPRLLAHPTIASKRWIYRQYDHMVQHGTVVEPGSDAAVVRLRLGDLARSSSRSATTATAGTAT
jgi:phosphoribosylformylglycinamidine (FGAM) synthase-like enzyme